MSCPKRHDVTHLTGEHWRSCVYYEHCSLWGTLAGLQTQLLSRCSARDSHASAHSYQECRCLTNQLYLQTSRNRERKTLNEKHNTVCLNEIASLMFYRQVREGVRAEIDREWGEREKNEGVRVAAGPKMLKNVCCGKSPFHHHSCFNVTILCNVVYSLEQSLQNCRVCIKGTNSPLKHQILSRTDPSW